MPFLSRANRTAASQEAHYFRRCVPSWVVPKQSTSSIHSSVVPSVRLSKCINSNSPRMYSSAKSRQVSEDPLSEKFEQVVKSREEFRFHKPEIRAAARMSGAQLRTGDGSRRRRCGPLGRAAGSSDGLSVLERGGRSVASPIGLSVWFGKVGRVFGWSVSSTC